MTASKHPSDNSSNWQLKDFKVEPILNKTRFHDLQLDEGIMRALHNLNFPYCTPIQAQILSHSLKGSDAIGRAQTGTGKTAAFLITILEQLLRHAPPKERYLGEPRALVLAPTRELVSQIAKDANALAKYSDINIVSLIGGTNFAKQQKELAKFYCDVIIATPGRLLDFCKRQEVHLDLLEVLVLDEADRMLDMGFIPQVKQIMRQAPPAKMRQTLMFSATFSDDILNLAKQWLFNPVTVEIEPESVVSNNVSQHIYSVASGDKDKLLLNLLRQNDWQRIIIFANRKDQVRNICEQLLKSGIKVEQMSGDVEQKKRVRVLEQFRTGKIRVLVATDVAGRGIHVDNIDCVINYDLPEIAHDYVHRIGRTGRAGAIGSSISFADEDNSFALIAIEDLIGHKITCELPSEELLK